MSGSTFPLDFMNDDKGKGSLRNCGKHCRWVGGVINWSIMGKTDEAKVRPRKPHTSAVSKKIFWFWLKNWKVWSCLGSTEAKFKKLWQYCTNSMEHIMYLKDNPQYPSISMTNFSHALNMNKMPADQKIFLLHSSGFCLYSARLEMLTPTDCGPHWSDWGFLPPCHYETQWLCRAGV